MYIFLVVLETMSALDTLELSFFEVFTHFHLLKLECDVIFDAVEVLARI